MEEQVHQAAHALLERSFLFQDAPPGAAESTLSDVRCCYTSANRGEVIYSPHAFRRCLGLILSGTVQVSSQALIINTLGPGDLFGAAALFQSRDDYATTLTACSACTLLLLPQPLVEELLETYPSMARSYIAYLSGRIRFLSDKIEGLIAGRAERKLAQYLLAFQNDRLVLDCSITDLAKRLNVGRASLYRAFDALEGIGAVKKQGKEIIILDQLLLQNV